MLRVGVGHREGVDTAQVLAAVIADVRVQLGATPAAAAIGAHARLLPEFALAVHTADDGFYIRTPISSDASDGTIAFGGEVPQGAEVQLSEAVREHLLAETERSLDGFGTHATGPERTTMCPAAVLVFSCAARKQILGTRIGLEVAAIERTLPGVPVFGFYAGGEIAPLVAGGEPRMHNATMVVLALGTCSEGQVDQSSHTRLRRPEPAPLSPALMARKLRRAEHYRVRAEDTKEHSTAMLRTIGNEVDAARGADRRAEQRAAPVIRRAGGREAQVGGAAAQHLAGRRRRGAAAHGSGQAGPLR